jgi:uncharacterized protein
MRIVVLSDTHMPRSAKSLPAPVVKALGSADYILHAGDWTTSAVADKLAKYAPLDGVAGNNDGQDLVKRFGYKKLLELGGVRIGIVHGHGVQGTTESRAWEAFRRDKVDVILFGHSHVPLYKERNGVLLFNPGSPTDKRRQKAYSFGVWTVQEGTIEARIHYYSKEERP